MADESSAAFGASRREAEKLNAEMARLRREAASLVAEEQKLSDQRGRTRSRIDEEVRRGRINESTVSRRGQNVASEAAAQRRAAERVRTSRAETNAEERLTRARDAASRSLSRQARLGPYPITRNVQEMALLADNMERISRFSQIGGPLTQQRQPALPPGPAGGYPPPASASYVRGSSGSPFAGDLYRDADRYAQAADRARVAESRWVQTAAAANPTLQRHGTLSTEFFQAASRGTVTLRELGRQTTGTIGKFGGWLGAGAAIYVAVDALSALGRGALDAQGGVNDLQRVIDNVDAEKLRGSFRGLAEDFNVPMKDAADAVYQMGKVFKTQEGAVRGAETALFAVKIGELDVATATRYLTSIIQGANLSAEDMRSVFDQVNEGQNQFGASIESTLAGLAKATGSFRLGGGDVQRQLLPWIVAGQRLTGQTGDVVGTAFQRIPNYLKQANNQATLRQFGVDPEADVGDIIQQILNQSRKGRLNKDQIQQLSSAVFGTFYGPRVGTALFQNPESVAQYQKQLSPEAAEGSAAKELDKLLGSVREKIAAIGVQLEVMGDNLAGTGLLDIFGLMIVAMGQALDITNFLLEGFNQLPDGVRKTLSYLLQAMILIRALRRFQVGEIFQPPGTQATGARGALARLGGAGSRGNEFRLLREAQARAVETYSDRQVDADSRARDAAITQRVSGERLAIEQQKLAQIADDNGLKTEEQRQANERFLRQQGRVNILQHQIARAAADGVTAQVDHEAATKRLNEVQQQQAAGRRRFRNRGAFFPFFGRDQDAALRAAQGEYIPTTGERPTTVPPRQVAVGENARQLRIFSEGTVIPADAQREAKRADAAATRAQRAATRVRGFVTGGFSGKLGNALGSFGNLIFGVSIALIAAEGLKALFESMSSELDELATQGPATARSAEELEASLKRAREANRSGGAIGQTLNDLKGGLFGVDPDELSGKALEDYNNRLGLQNRQRREGLPLSFLRPDQLNNRIDELGKVTDDKKFRARAQRITKEIEAAGLGEKEVAQLKEALNRAIGKVAVEAEPSTLRGRLKAISDPDELSTLLEAQSSLVDLGRKENTIKRARLIYERMVKLIGKSKNPEDLKKLAEARGSLMDLIGQQVENQMSLIEARGDLRASSINEATNPIGKQRAELSNLQKQLAFMQRNRKSFTLADILGLQAEINQAEIALVEAIRAQADEVARARFEIARAQAGDNAVKAARVDVQEARYESEHARTLAERLSARAGLINARRDLREQIANREIEDIEFQADIGKLTLSQQISAYQRLLRTHKLTRDQRRDLKRRIHQLSEEAEGEGSDFALDVGSIKLPTIYEIRRAVAGGANGTQFNVTNAPNVNVTVTDPNAAAAVGAAIDKSLGAGTQAAMRNAGVL